MADAADFPAEFFVPKSTWFAVKTPRPSSPKAFLESTLTFKLNGGTYLPLFTTWDNANDFIIAHLLRLEPLALASIPELGATLEGFQRCGISHVSFDPEAHGREPVLHPIADAIEALLRHHQRNPG